MQLSAELRSNIAGIKGVGATPEAIEQVPVLYDVLFELPWHSTKPDPKKWRRPGRVHRFIYGLVGIAYVGDSAGVGSFMEGVHAVIFRCARWGMNNLEGWGGKNPDWWYERQEQLARKILARMRELGIEPVLIR